MQIYSKFHVLLLWQHGAVRGSHFVVSLLLIVISLINNALMSLQDEWTTLWVSQSIEISQELNFHAANPPPLNQVGSGINNALKSFILKMKRKIMSTSVKFTWLANIVSFAMQLQTRLMSDSWFPSKYVAGHSDPSWTVFIVNRDLLSQRQCNGKNLL